MENRDILIGILEDINPDVDYYTSTQLIDEGILTSFDVVLLITCIAEEYGVTVPAYKINADNFNSVEKILHLIRELEEDD